MRSFQRTIRRRHEPVEPTHTGRLERWLGAQQLASISHAFRQWYGPPVALGCVPGNVFVTAGGEFVGPISVGDELNQLDMTEAIVRRFARRRFALGTRQAGAFSNLSAVIAAYSGGKGQQLTWSKLGVAANAIGNSNELWTRTGHPAAGAAGAAAPGGTATTNSTTGNFGLKNPVNANTAHHLGGYLVADRMGNYLLIDQLFRVAKTMNSTATEAVTGTFSRYQSGTGTAADYIGGNFCFPADPTTVLAATAHNWTVCQYTDQDSNAAQSFPSIAGVSACVVGGIDLAVAGPSWFMPLAAGDVGVKALTQMQCSALVATGTIDFVVAHPIGMYSTLAINQAVLVDALTTALDQLTNIYDNACLTFLDIQKPATNVAGSNGIIKVVAE
jgi:hypothetical protein